MKKRRSSHSLFLCVKHARTAAKFNYKTRESVYIEREKLAFRSAYTTNYAEFFVESSLSLLVPFHRAASVFINARARRVKLCH